MSGGLEGRVALVLGASKGVGGASALALAAAGADLILCARTPSDLEAKAGNIRAATGRKVDPFALDVGDAAVTAGLLAEIRSGKRRVDILVWNVGGSPVGRFGDFEEADWREAIESHFFAALRFYKAVLPGMQERSWGRIVNVSSIQAKQPMPNNILSGATRLTLLGMAKALSREVIREGITINTLSPGQVATERLYALAAQRAEREGTSQDAVIATMLGDHPPGRHGEPEEFASLVAFLCSDAAGYLTGLMIPVDGGSARGVF